MAYKIDLLNAITAKLGGTTVHRYNINALNEWCTLAGGSGGHKYDIDAYNELATIYTGSGGFKFDIKALNAIVSELGGTAKTYTVDVLSQLGALLNQYPTVLNDGNTVAWYDYTQLDTITKDESNKVSRWNDRLGSGHDLIQAQDTRRPVYSAEGILFNGTTDYLQTEPFTLNQPEHIYMVVKQVTWTADDVFFDGITANTGRLRQRGTTPELRASSGSESSSNGNLPLDTYAIVRLLFNNPAGALQSKLQIDETTAAAFTGSTSNMGGFRLGGQTTGSFANIEVKEIIIRKVADSEADELEIYNYLYNKYWQMEMLTNSEDGGVFF